MAVEFLVNLVNSSSVSSASCETCGQFNLSPPHELKGRHFSYILNVAYPWSSCIKQNATLNTKTVLPTERIINSNASAVR